MLNSVTNGATVAYFPPQKTRDDSIIDFREAIKLLEEKSNVYNPENIQPDTDLRVDSIDLKNKFVVGVDGFEPLISSGTTITRTGGTKIPKPIAGAEKLPPVLSDEEQQKIMESSPEYIAAKKYSDSAQVEIVASDNNGQIVAVLWKDGSAFAESGSVIGSTPAETRQNLLKMPNVHLETYNTNEESPTRLEIEAEQVSFTKKHPELFQQIPNELLAAQENQLHSFAINDILTAHDKKLVDAVTPKTTNELKEVNELAVHIAIDRETGTLSGEVDENYINKLIAEQSSNNHAETIKFSALQKSLAFLQQERADFFRR